MAENMGRIATLADPDSNYRSCSMGRVRFPNRACDLAVWLPHMAACRTLRSRRYHPVSTIPAAPFVFLDGYAFPLWMVVLFYDCLPDQNPGSRPSFAWRPC